MHKKPPKIDLSIIVPVYNEEGGIEYAIGEVYKDSNQASIKRVVDSFEVIAVDDGSVDNSFHVLQKLKKRYKNLKIIKHQINFGLGASIITGVNNSTKDYVTYIPADGQALLREVLEGLKIAPHADLVLTQRGDRNDYNFYRSILSASLMVCMKLFFNLNFKDYNWVHIYKRKIFKSLNFNSKGVFYLAEVVVRSNKAGLKILEAKASYHPRLTGISKNAKLSIALQTLVDMAKLWIELRFK